MIFYQVMSDDYEDGDRYFATKAAAMKDAKQIVRGGGLATVHLVGIPDTKKKSILALANRTQCFNTYKKLWEDGK